MNSYFSLSNPIENNDPSVPDNTTRQNNISSTSNIRSHPPSNNTVVPGDLVINHWDNEVFDNDDFDSDQLDEDESYSWASGLTDQDVMGNFGVNVNCTSGRGSTSVNWRDWRSGNINDFILRSNQFTENLTSTNNTNLTRNTTSNIRPSTHKRSESKASNQIPNLVELCARYVASNVPFELVECFEQPVPEDLQLKITRASFPEHIENIRLYSCLANGSVDEYLRGEQLYHNKCVKKVMQIGFHLSAQVVISSPLGVNGNTNSNNTNQGTSAANADSSSTRLCMPSFIGNGNGASSLFASVSIVCDRKRITSCHCTCSKQLIPWCSHIVAVCLYRIVDAGSVEFRPPVSESFSKLKRDQLQKFAQYLISELPQQILPTAQKLLDELLKCDSDSSMNMMRGAPDPTAGASQNDISAWYLDEIILKENIHKTLLKFIVPTPNVVSDIECLEHASSATAAEYTNLLRPLRGREPEGMWNLISIVREMFRRRDKNSIPLLNLLTRECIEVDQILQFWFLVKASQAHSQSDKSLAHTVTMFSQRNLQNLSSGFASNSAVSGGNSGTHTSPLHQACANLMDEIVTLWRIACLSPYAEEEKLDYKALLLKWHDQVVDRLRKFCNSIINSSSNTWSNMNQQSQAAANLNNGQKLLKRLEMDIFPGFLPAINICSENWSAFDFNNIYLFQKECFKQTAFLTLDETFKRDRQEQQATCIKITSQVSVSSSCSSSSSAASSSLSLSSLNSSNQPLQEVYKTLTSGETTTPKQSETFKSRESESSSQASKSQIAKSEENSLLDVLFYRCEALYYHSFIPQTCILAQTLADHMLNTTKHLQSLFNSAEQKAQLGVDEEVLSTEKTGPKPNNNTGRQKNISNFHNTVLWRSSLLCKILNDCSNQLTPEDAAINCQLNLNRSSVKQLAFRIGICGLETPRSPAISKALEVKLLNQEQDLVNLLKQISIDREELSLLKTRASHLKNSGSDYNKQQRLLNPNAYQSLPIQLAVFLFDSFLNLPISNICCSLGEGETTQNNLSQTFYQNLGFEAACTVLGMKANASESAHPILCEGIRRQKGDLALNLLLTHKDEEQSLLKILEKLLDRDVYVLFKPDSVVMVNPFNPNFKKIQQAQLNEFLSDNSANNETKPLTGTIDKQLHIQPIATMSISDISNQNNAMSSILKDEEETAVKKSSAKPYTASSLYIDSLSSGWEESENESPNLSKSVSLLETKYRCLNLNQQPVQNSRELKEETESMTKDDGQSCEKDFKSGPGLVKTSKIKVASKSSSGDESDASSSSLTQAEAKESILKSRDSEKVSETDQKAVTVAINSGASCSDKRSNETNEKKTGKQIQRSHNSNQPLNNNTNNNNQNNRGQTNQPSVALAHFMFEFSKTVLSKAGGTISASVYLNHHNLGHGNQQGGGVAGPHRNLHLCSFLISLYALGLYNCVQPTWLMRTYSSTVTWVNSQATDIGYAAICILIECWHGRLTPSECVTLADRVSRGRDNMTVKAAAELALSGLKYANYMKLTEIQRALIQCKEQSNEMLERACIVVENCVKRDTGGGASSLFEILFTLARRWEELFNEDLNLFNSKAQTGAANLDQSSTNLIQNPIARSDLLSPNQNTIQSASNFDLNKFQHQQQQNGMTNNFFNPAMSPNYNQPQAINNPAFNNFQGMQFQQQAPSQIMNIPNLMNQNTRMPYAPFINNSMVFQQQNHNQFYNQPINVNNSNPNYLYNNTPNIQPGVFQNNNNIIPRNQQQPQQFQSVINSIQSNQINMSQIFPNITQTTVEVSLNIPPIKHLQSAFRIGINGLEALPKRIDGANQIKYRQMPSYSDDVKWLWKLAVKLDNYQKNTNCMQQFCQVSATVIQNPFLLQELAFDTANYLSRCNPSQLTIILRSPLLNVLVQRCLNLYLRCCMSKLHHITSSEHEDFVNMILTARNIFYYSGNMNCFSDLIQNLRRSNRCKKDLWTKIYNSLNTNNFQ